MCHNNFDSMIVCIRLRKVGNRWSRDNTLLNLDQLLSALLIIGGNFYNLIILVIFIVTLNARFGSYDVMLLHIPPHIDDALFTIYNNNLLYYLFTL